MRHRCEKGLFISPKRVLTEVLGHVKLEVISNIKYDSFDHRVTINFCGELVEGKGSFFVCFTSKNTISSYLIFF